MDASLQAETVLEMRANWQALRSGLGAQERQCPRAPRQHPRHRRAQRRRQIHADEDRARRREADRGKGSRRRPGAHLFPPGGSADARSRHGDARTELDQDAERPRQPLPQRRAQERAGACGRAQATRRNRRTARRARHSPLAPLDDELRHEHDRAGADRDRESPSSRQPGPHPRRADCSSRAGTRSRDCLASSR